MIETSITPNRQKPSCLRPNESIAGFPRLCRKCGLDQALAELLPTHSRSRLQQWPRPANCAWIGVVRRPRDPVAGGKP